MKYTSKDLADVMSLNSVSGKSFSEKDVTPKMVTDFNKGMEAILKKDPKYDIRKDDYDGKIDDDFVEMLIKVTKDGGKSITESYSVKNIVETPTGKRGEITSIGDGRMVVVTDDGHTEEYPEDVEMTILEFEGKLDGDMTTQTSGGFQGNGNVDEAKSSNALIIANDLIAKNGGKLADKQSNAQDVANHISDYAKWLGLNLDAEASIAALEEITGMSDKDIKKFITSHKLWDKVDMNESLSGNNRLISSHLKDYDNLLYSYVCLDTKIASHEVNGNDLTVHLIDEDDDECGSVTVTYGGDGSKFVKAVADDGEEFDDVSDALYYVSNGYELDESKKLNQTTTDTKILESHNRQRMGSSKINEAFVGDKVKTPSGKEGYVTSKTSGGLIILTDDGKTEEVEDASVTILEATNYEKVPHRIPLFEDFKKARARKITEALSENQIKKIVKDAIKSLDGDPFMNSKLKVSASSTADKSSFMVDWGLKDSSSLFGMSDDSKNQPIANKILDALDKLGYTTTPSGMWRTIEKK